MSEVCQEKSSRWPSLLGRFLFQLPVGRGMEFIFLRLYRGENGDTCACALEPQSLIELAVSFDPDLVSPMDPPT